MSTQSLKFSNSYQSSDLFTTDFKINLITTKYFRANTPLSSNGVTVLHYGMKSVSQLFLGNELLFLNPLSLFGHRLFKNKQNVEAEVFSTNVTTYQNVLVSYNNHFTSR